MLAGLACAELASGQRVSNWRVYKAADGLSESKSTAITVSPRGNVWVKHAEADTISWLDGYAVHHLPSPGGSNYRVYESGTGQLWSLYSGGLLLFKEGQWVRFPVAEIQAENQKKPFRGLVETFALAPLGSNRIMFVVSGGLLEFNATANQTTMLRQASQSGLGEFLDLAVGSEGSLWITGRHGLAHRLAPRRGQAAVWQEIPLPGNLTDVKAPVADEEGGVTVTAVRQGADERVMAHFDGQNWEVHRLLNGKVRQAWPGLDGTYWGVTYTALSRWEGGREIPEKDAPLTGPFWDVTVEPKGAFWLATSEGLMRYAPLTWRAPPELAGSNAVVHAIWQDHGNRLWFAGDTALHLWEPGHWQSFDYPERAGEILFEPTDRMSQLADGRFALNATDHFFLFDPDKPGTNKFQAVVAPQGRAARLLGQLRDGTLCVQTWGRGSPLPPSHLEIFDGQAFRALSALPPNYSLASRWLIAYEAANKDLWLGGSSGVGLVRDQKLQTFGRADGQPPEVAFCLLEWPDGRMWCGGLDKVYEFNGKSWTIVRGGFDRVNRMIRTPDGVVWLASGDGLYRYFNGVWLVNSVEEGLPSAAVYEVFQGQGGNLWAATARGLARFYPSADIDPPRAVIHTANGRKEFYFDAPISLSLGGHDKWKFTAADHLLFSHLLDSARWSPFAPNNTVLYDQLAPGKHTLEARAMDRNGNVIAEPQAARLEFAVILPWYLERRLLIIFSGGLAATLFFAWVAFNRHLRLKRSFAEVERIVAERTRELEQANQALLHSQKMRALGTFAAGIAHDFNSILSIIKGSAQIIEAHVGDRDKIRTRVDRIKTVVDQGSGIVKALLGYSRDSAQDLVWTEVNPIVEDAVKLLGDRFLTGVALRCELAQGLPQVACIKDLLQQILVNLILNAAEAMNGHGEVTVRTEIWRGQRTNLVLTPTASERHVAIAVQDHGMGIAPEIQSRIFEPFFTTKAFSTRRGTGLGLSMVYEFAKDQGFGLVVDSVVGHGSTFTVVVPVGAGAGQPPAAGEPVR